MIRSRKAAWEGLPKRGHRTEIPRTRRSQSQRWPVCRILALTEHPICHGGGTWKTPGIGARLRAQQKQQSPEVRNSPQWAEGSGSVHVAETPVTQAATVPPAAHRSQSRRLSGPGRDDVGSVTPREGRPQAAPSLTTGSPVSNTPAHFGLQARVNAALSELHTCQELPMSCSR